MNDQAGAAAAPTGRGPWLDRYMADAAPGGPAEARLLDLATVRGFVWRQRFVLVGVTAAALLLAFLITLLATPIYQATASVRVDPEQREIFEDSLNPSIAINQLDSYLETIARVAETRALAGQVVESLKLDRRDDFLGVKPGDRPEGVNDRAWANQRRETAIDSLLGNVEAEVPVGQRVVELGYRSPDPQLAATIANAYADVLLTDDLRRSLQKNAYAESYLRKEIASVRTRLDGAQRKALGYARANSIIGDSLLPASGDVGSSAVPQTITASNLGSVAEQLGGARARRIQTEQAWRAVAGAPATEMPAFVSSGAGQALVNRRSEAESALAELRQRYGPEHPQVRELQAQVGALNRQIDRFGGNLKSSLRKDYEVALRQEQALAAELQRVSGDTLDEQDRRVAFNQLNVEAQALQTQLDALLERYNQIAASANVTPSTITLLDRAAVPGSPVSPNLINNLLVGLILGGGLAVGLAVLRETLDDRLRSEDDVENKLGIPLLGITPLIDKSEEVSESMALAEAHSSIRAAIDFGLVKTDHNVILLTSSQSVEGKTTTAVAVAREYARLGRKVLLVDADLRRPSVAGRFGVKRPASGFAEVLAGSAQMRDVLLASPGPNLDVLPVGAIPPNPVEIVSSPRVDEFFEQQRRVYDLIVVDCPPIVGLADAPLLSRVADGVIFVVESNRAHFGQAKTALRRLRDANARMLGVVLTKFRALDAGYNYDYNYSYYTYGERAQG